LAAKRVGTGKHYSITQRVQAFALAEYRISLIDVVAYTGIPRRTIQSFQKKARDRDYDLAESRILTQEHVEDAPRSGRPRIFTEDKEKEILDKIRVDSDGRERSSASIALDTGVSAQSVWRTLKKHDLKKRKRTTKPGLTDAMREARLQFCLRVKDWTIENWKKVI